MKALSENGTHTNLCNPETIQAIFELERRRQKALVDVDLDTLHSLFDDELIHVHSTGLVHDKSQLMAHIARKRGFLAIERGPLHVQGTNALAVLSGPIINHLRGADGGEEQMHGFVTQVVHLTQEGWKFLHFQLTVIRES